MATARKKPKARTKPKPKPRLKLEVRILKCQRCGHMWVPRGKKDPEVCPYPRCHSTQWNKPPAAQRRRQKRKK